MSDVVTFRVYPEAHSALYAKVYIYPTLARLRRGVRELDTLSTTGTRYPSTLLNKTIGHTCGITITRRRDNRKLPVFAYVYLSATQLGMGVVTHECVHAACRWMARRKVPLLSFVRVREYQDPKEERFASGVDRMAAQVVRKARTRGVLHG